MNKKITYKKACQRFIDQGRTDIELIEETYIIWTQKAKFYDNIINDYFYNFPYKVYEEKSGHPKRKSQKISQKLKIDFKEAHQRFIDQGRTDIELIEDGYEIWGKKAKFYDKINDEYFWAIPYNIWTRQSKPRKRCFENRIINFNDAQQKFINQGRTDIELIEDGYNGFYKKSQFLDKTINEIFYSTPAYVLKNNLTHPKLKVKNNTVSFDEANKHFSDRNDIELIEYNGWSEKSKFLDKIVNEYFWATPYNVHNRRSAHRKRYIQNSTLSFQEASTRFVAQGRTDIELVEDEYNGWKSKSKFWDKEIKEYFMAVPRNVYNRGSCHPKRKKIPKAQIDLYNDINLMFPNNNVLLEQRLSLGKKRGYSADIYFSQYNIIIEFNGDYWHCNPKLYKEDYFNTRCKRLAKDMWKRDQTRNDNLKKAGYKVLIVWEYDYNNNKEQTLNNLKNEIINIIENKNF